MGEIYIAIDKEIETYLWEKYPIVAHFCAELNRIKHRGIDFEIDYKGVFNRYDNVNITCYQEIIVFEIYKDSYTFDLKTVVFNHKDITTYEIIKW